MGCVHFLLKLFFKPWLPEAPGATELLSKVKKLERALMEELDGSCTPTAPALAQAHASASAHASAHASAPASAPTHASAAAQLPDQTHNLAETCQCFCVGGPADNWRWFPVGNLNDTSPYQWLHVGFQADASWWSSVSFQATGSS